MTHSTNRRSTRRGFTLMELLVVLAILVLLMAMVAPRFLGVQKKADVNAAKTQIGLFKGALERYALDMKDFPLTEQGLQSLCEEPAEVDTMGGTSETPSSEPPSDPMSEDKKGEGNTNWDGPYISSTQVPKDPWGHAYQYEYPPTRGKGEFPDIWSFGPDGQDDTEDDIVSWTDSQEGGEFGGETNGGSTRESTPPPSSPPRENNP